MLAALEGRYDEAQQGWQAALELDQDCLQARLNRDLLQVELELAGPYPQPEPTPSSGRDSFTPLPAPRSPIRVAILSFLFNWPSTGGGKMHTAGLAQFLARAGYEVKHYLARYPAWRIGRVTDELISPSEALAFDEASWDDETDAGSARLAGLFSPATSSPSSTFPGLWGACAACSTCGDGGRGPAWPSDPETTRSA